MQTIEYKQLPNLLPTSRFKNLLNWLSRPYELLDECAEQYGDLFTIHFFGFPPLVFLSDPQAMKEIFALDERYFDVGRANVILKPLVGDNSLLLLDGTHHKRERKLLMPPFHGAKVASYAETICQITRDVCQAWQPGQTVVAGEAMPEITMEVILQTVFGLREGDRYQELKTLLVQLLDLTGSPLSSSLLFFNVLQQDLGRWSPWGKFVHTRRRVYALLQAEIDERRAADNFDGDDMRDDMREDMLSLMLLARDENGEPMTDDELKDELITMLAAGHETTASVLCWALYWVHKLPEVKAKLMAELESVAEDAGLMAIAKLPYLNAIASESLRLYPIVPVVSPRIAKAPTTIQGRTYPAGTYFAPSIYNIHHREDLFPDSKTFNPERFLERQYAPYEFVPFGGGNHRCLGYALAKLEINLVLATVLKARSLTLASDEIVTPRRRGVVMATSNGVPLTVNA